MSSIKLTVDQSSSLAYITLSSEKIDNTVDHDGCVLVDLDAMGVAVGIELLDLDAVIPFDELTTRYHVNSAVVNLLRVIRPTINTFVLQSKSRKNDGSDLGSLEREQSVTKRAAVLA